MAFTVFRKMPVSTLSISLVSAPLGELGGEALGAEEAEDTEESKSGEDGGEDAQVGSDDGVEGIALSGLPTNGDVGEKLCWSLPTSGRRRKEGSFRWTPSGLKVCSICCRIHSGGGEVSGLLVCSDGGGVG